MFDATATQVSAVSVDGLEPRASVAPASLREVRDALRDASRDEQAVIPIGTAARLSLGNIPAAYHTALSTRALNEIVAYEPADMTVTAQAGLLVADLQRTLSDRGQFLPLDTVGAPGTIGGLLAANASGALRHRYGTSRDWLIGMTVVHADGATSKSGGRVVKNVSGYDLHKVHIGAIGTLAVITEATFKLAPLPKSDSTIAIACPSATAAASIISASNERGLSVQAAELLSPTAAHALELPSRWTAFMRIAGGAAGCTRTLRDIRDLAALAEADQTAASPQTWAQWSTTLASSPLRLRVSVMPSRVADTAEAIDRRFAGDRVAISATASAGLLRVGLTPADEATATALAEQVTNIASQRNGHVVIDAAPVALKHVVDVFGASRDDLTIMRRLKSEFDPDRILSPGRFMGRL